MNVLRTADRDRSMTALVSFHDVPIRRAIAFAIRDIEKHGGRVAIFSANRTTVAIREHNRLFGTNLSGQQELIDAFNAGHGNPANPISLTSHCGFADATVAALLNSVANGLSMLRAGERIPYWAEGVDLSDRGKIEDPSRFLRVAHKLGYDFRQPYKTGGEQHHVILVKSPIHTLESRGQIAKERHA